MLRVDMAQWGQTLEDLRQASPAALHRRTHERFQALYLIASGRFNATTCAAHVCRRDETVLGWVHRYNEGGPAALAYRRTGGRSPLFNPGRSSGSSRSSSVWPHFAISTRIIGLVRGGGRSGGVSSDPIRSPRIENSRSQSDSGLTSQRLESVQRRRRRRRAGGAGSRCRGLRPRLPW